MKHAAAVLAALALFGVASVLPNKWANTQPGRGPAPPSQTVPA